MLKRCKLDFQGQEQEQLRLITSASYLKYFFGRGQVVIYYTFFRIHDMVFHMKTTLVINDRIMLKVKEEAVRTGRNISELVESALAEFLKPKKKSNTKKANSLPSFKAGKTYIDVSSREELYRVMESDSD